MATAEGLFAASGAVAFAGNMAKAKAFPENGVLIISATIALVILSSTTKNSAIATPVKALAALTLLVSVYVYVPAFTRKVERNG